MLKSFLCNELEPLAYVIYLFAVLLHLPNDRSVRYKVLIAFYGACALLLYIGILFFDDNNWNYNVLFFANICVSSWYYYGLIPHSGKREIIIISWLINTFLFVYVNFFQQQYLRYNTNVYAASFITIVLYSLLYLHQLMTTLEDENILLNFDFWLICGYLLYFLGSFVIILYYNDAALQPYRGTMWMMHNITLFACSLFTAYTGFRIFKKKKLRHV